MSPKALINTPGRAADAIGAAGARGDRLGARVALPRTLRAVQRRAVARAPAHLSPLRHPRRGWAGHDSRAVGAGAEAVAARECDLGWARGIEERYELMEVLGEGSFGTVRAARRRDSGERFAVKMLPKGRGREEDWERYASLLQKEVSLWTAVQNSHDRHVARLLDVYEDDEYLYLVQEICEGGDVQKLMKEQGCLGEREAAQVISGVLSMLAACHDRNICYGDVKPANFLLKSPYPCRRHLVDSSAPKGDIVIKGVDFGCSQKLDGEGRLNKRTGTPLYMAPEIFFGWYGLEVDIWAAGMMLYQLISGHLPFFGDKPEAFTKGPKMLIVQALMDNELEMTGGVWDTVSDEVKDLISKMLDVDYNTRISARAAQAHTWIQRHCKHLPILFNSEEGLRMPKDSALECLNSPKMPLAGAREQGNV